MAGVERWGKGSELLVWDVEFGCGVLLVDAEMEVGAWPDAEGLEVKAGREFEGSWFVVSSIQRQ